MTFEELKLDERILEGIHSMGFKNATPVQEQSIPHILEGKDVIACAQTGTGKTAAYLLPVFHRILNNPPVNGVNTLILAPTRELVIQIDQNAAGLGYFASVSSLAIYGGNDGSTWDQQKKALKEGAEVIIATPGRLIAHLQSSDVNFNSIQHLVLDEADRMLEMGFIDDIYKILQYLPARRQNIMFSATMPPKIRDLAKKIMSDPAQISIAISKPAEGIRQQAFLIYDKDKVELLMKMLNGKEEELQSIIIFCSTKQNVKVLEKELKKLKFSVTAFHSDLEQAEREGIINRFRNREIQMLVATDILSRGLDIEGISMVINFDVPHDAEDYVHRIGRTARAATTGTAITFINEKEVRKFSRIEKLIEKEIEKLPLPEGINPGPAYNVEAPHGNSGSNKRRNFKRKKNFGHKKNNRN
ncbi:MAG: DEAD/DEAH box helicase [Cytophagaceae bacterium]